MTLRRVVALAQASTMILLLAPGPSPVGPSPVQAAFAPVEPEASTVYDASGKGVGCLAGTSKYKGPTVPKDPPWPPGAKPTPSPTPEPSPSPSADVAVEPEAEAVGGTTAYVAATDVRLAQADLETEATPTSTGGLISGIDVSWHKGDIDFAKVKGAGHRFAIIKATENNDFIDPNYPTNFSRARAAGLVAGAYHVFDYTLDGKAQADHFIDRLEAVGGITGALPPVIDVECWSYYGASIHAVSTTRLRDLVDRLYQRTGLTPMIYTSSRMWSEVLGDPKGFDDLHLWTACWDCEPPPTTAAGWDDWSFWQVTNSLSVPGIRGNVDGNYFVGNRKALKALRTRPFSIEGGALAASSEQVELDLGNRTATHIRTSDDGETWSKWSKVSGSPTALVGSDEGEYTVYAQLRNGPGLKSPVFSDSIFVDHTPPEMTTPTVSLREGPIGGTDASIPIAVRWEARDAVAGLTDGTVSVDCGDDDFMRSEAPGSAEPGEAAAWEAPTMLFPDAACGVTGIARDGAGNETRDTAHDITATVIQAADRAEVRGDEVGVIARRGPDAGRAAVLLDGQALGLVDLYAPEPSGPEVVLTAELSGGGEITVEPTGSADPASTGSAVVVDGFVTLSR